MDEFLILLQAKLDEAKSKKLINADIDKIQKQLDKLKLQAEIDPETISSLTKQLEGVLKQKITISDIGIDTSKVTKASQRLGSELNKSISDGTAKSSNTLNNFRKSLQNIGMDSKSIDVVADRINQLGVQIDSLNQAKTHTPNRDILSVNISGIDHLGQAIKLTEQYDISTGILIKSIDDVSTAQQKMTSSFERDVVTYTNRLNDLQTKYSNASIDYSEFEKSFNSFKNGEITVNQLSIAFNQLENSAKLGVQSLKSQTSSFDPIQQTLNNMRNLPSMIKMLETNIDGLKDKSNFVNVSVEDLTSTYQELSTVMDSVGGKVPITEEWTTKYRNLMATVTSLTEKVETLKKVEASDNSAVKLSERIREINRLMDNGFGASEYQNRINTITASLEKYGVETQQAKDITNSLQSTFDSMKGLSGKELVLQADKLEQGFKAAKISVEQAKNAYDKYMQPVTNEKATTLINRINTFLSKNTKITKEAKIELEGYIQELNKGVSLNRWNDINLTLKKTENSMRGLHKLGASLKDQMSQAAQSFTQWLSVSSAVMLLISKAKNAITELKDVNTLLTEISKANDKLSKSDLTNIGNNSFDVASKYGKKSTDYLSGVQEASRAGYENAEGIAELSVAAQGAGDMTAELANQMIIATDKAYKLNGSVTDLTKVLDGMNYITNHNAVNMTELSESMSIVGSTAASFGVDVDETTAALGTMIATTQQSGSEVARAFKAILLNIRQVSDEEEGIDADGLTKYEAACNALNVKLKETKDGVLSLRDPMEVLKELSVEYNKLEETDIRRTNLLSSVGGKLRATQLDALLRQWSIYEAMLQQYADGAGSMAVEAEKTANSWEGSMNRLSNTWAATVDNIADSDAIITIINVLNTLLSAVNSLTEAFGTLGTIGIGAGLSAFVKNFA